MHMVHISKTNGEGLNQPDMTAFTCAFGTAIDKWELQNTSKSLHMNAVISRRVYEGGSIMLLAALLAL